MKTTIPHTIADHEEVAWECQMEMKIEAYEEEMKMRERIDQFLAAKVCGPYMEVCPYCAEPLWLELGYWSWNEQLLWEGFYYRTGMPCSHYRDVE